MSISKVVVLCCTLVGIHAASAHDLVNQALGDNLDVPPDPYRSIFHNPPDDDTGDGVFDVPPDPYKIIPHNPPGD